MEALQQDTQPCSPSKPIGASLCTGSSVGQLKSHSTALPWLRAEERSENGLPLVAPSKQTLVGKLKSSLFMPRPPQDEGCEPLTVVQNTLQHNGVSKALHSAEPPSLSRCRQAVWMCTPPGQGPGSPSTPKHQRFPASHTSLDKGKQTSLSAAHILRVASAKFLCSPTVGPMLQRSCSQSCQFPPALEPGPGQTCSFKA